MELKENIAEFLKSQPAITLATENNGQPMAHPVVFASDGCTVYFITSSTSRKMDNISKNPKAAYSTYKNTMNWMETYSVQMEGVASVVSDESEKQKAFGMLMEKYPPMKDMEVQGDQAVVKIEPKLCFLSDYSKGFGHRDEINF